MEECLHLSLVREREGISNEEYMYIITVCDVYTGT